MPTLQRKKKQRPKKAKAHKTKDYKIEERETKTDRIKDSTITIIGATLFYLLIKKQNH
jgi:hypothetical protein